MSREEPLVAIDVPGNQFTGNLLVEACRAEGIPCRLLTADAGGWAPGIELYHAHRLLVRESDRDRVEEIVRLLDPRGG